MNENIPRGFRNHNPLNIERNGDKWEGLAPEQSDPRFCQFTSNVYGYRAAFIILHRYIEVYHCNTIRKIINRWAPARDGNHTTSYIRQVVRISKVPADEPISFDDTITMTAIVSAMTMVENGVREVNVEEVREGKKMAGTSRVRTKKPG